LIFLAGGYRWTANGEVNKHALTQVCRTQKAMVRQRWPNLEVNMAKSVSLRTGRAFGTVTAANEHFALILNGRGLKQEFSGDELADIRAVYEDYCAKTGWNLQSPPASFYPTYDRGPGYTTRCYAVIFEDGTTGNFSMEKALRAIAAQPSRRSASPPA
jgi:hypothetical protein